MTFGDVAERLTRLDARLAFQVARPSGPGWVPLADRTVLEHWIDETVRTRGCAPNVATARVALNLSARVVRPLMALLHLENIVPNATQFWVHREAAALAIEATTYEQARLDRSADQLCTTFAPIFQDLRAIGRYGRGPMWGGLLDMVGATSMLAARIANVSRPQTWQRVEILSGLIEERIWPMKPKRPHCTPIELTSGGSEPITVKGTCCLKYREHGLRVGLGTDSTAYCKTCPHIPDGVRQDRCLPGIEHDLERHRIAVS